MQSPREAESAPRVDWLDFCRRAGAAVQEALAGYGTAAERSREIGRGEGGDMTLAIDRAAEDAVFAELEKLAVPVTAISEERGELPVAGGSEVCVVIDPIDGSLNAKRGLPFYALSIAVGPGRTMGDLETGFVLDLASGHEWSAQRGLGAFLNERRLGPLEDGPLEMFGLETARPERVQQALEAIVATGARRVRAIGSVALTLCLVAGGNLDAMGSLRAVRSVDAAAGQLIVREAGGAVAFPEAAEDPLLAAIDLDMRSPVLAARSKSLLGRLAPLV